MSSCSSVNASRWDNRSTKKLYIFKEWLEEEKEKKKKRREKRREKKRRIEQPNGSCDRPADKMPSLTRERK